MKTYVGRNRHQSNRSTHFGGRRHRPIFRSGEIKSPLDGYTISGLCSPTAEVPPLVTCSRDRCDWRFYSHAEKPKCVSCMRNELLTLGAIQP